jgi:Toastrack DUF4097
MMRVNLTGAGLWGTLALALAAGGLSAQDDTWTWSERVGSGDVLEVKNITGDIHVVRGSGTTLDVRAEKTGRRSDFDRIAVHVERDSHGFTICAVYDPRDDDSCDSRHNRGDRDIRAGVDFEVSLPSGVELIATSVTGDVEVRDVDSDVTARTVSGDVDVSTSGIASASTVSGSVDVQLAGTDWDDLEFNTVSGDITLTLPDGIGADVDFASLSGDLESDFDISSSARRHHIIGSRVRGVIGGGGKSLELHTVSGDVRIRRSRS